MLDFLIKNIGNLGVFGLLTVAVIFFGLFGVKTSYFEFSGILQYFKNRNKEKNIIEDDYYVCKSKGDDGEDIGFEIPREFVKIFGKSWSRDDIKLYRLLEERWEHCNVVDITECNATTTLISLLENKAQKFGSLTIFASHEQMKLLNYLQQLKNIKFEVR